MISVQNIKKGIVTTILGVILILAAIITVFISSMGIGWVDASPILFIGLTLLGLKDPK